MMKTIFALGAALLLSASPSKAAPLRILAATNDLAAIARAVAGPAAEIKVVARPDRDLHSLEVRPSMMTMAAKADVYLAVGLSLDLWSEGIVQGSRNTKLHVVTCSDAVQPLEVPAGKVDASMGDVHPYGNPHYWLDPENAVIIAHDLAKNFTALDAGQAGAYEANAEAFAKEVEQRVPVWKEELHNVSFIEYHRTWVYAAQRFGMNIEGQVEPLPGIPPTAQHLAALSTTIREKHVPVVIRDLYHPDGPLEFLQRETGARVAVVPASCDEPTPESYFQLFDRLASALNGKS
ncbi:MAG TPA: metal ABC transporter substrate-binding protein [bacterium]|nr:metal ABC transporter substrate-binding protein [bacterium]